MSNLQLDFDALNAEKTELTDFLSQPDSYADKNFAAKNRRLGEINTLLELGKKRTQLEADIEMASNDPDDYIGQSNHQTYQNCLTTELVLCDTCRGFVESNKFQLYGHSDY